MLTMEEFNEQFGAIAPGVERPIRRKCGDIQEADLEDIFAEARLHAIKNFSSYAAKGTLKAFVSVIYRNAIFNGLNSFSRNKRFKSAPEVIDLIPATVDPPSSSSDEVLSQVLQAMHQLNPELRDVLTLKFFSGNKLTDRQVAKLLGVSLRTISKRKKSAIEALQLVFRNSSSQ